MTTTFPLVGVDRRESTPLYRQIYDAFRGRVLRGDLRSGEMVPSSRELARELRISRLPVLNAYAQLMAEGFFVSRVGAGTFIADVPRRDPRVRPSGERRISANAAALPKWERPVWAEKLGPFQVGQPDLHSFPVEIWSRIVARQSRHMRVKSLQYGDPMGLHDLRDAIAHYVRTSRSVRCEAEQILIVSGSQQALDLSTRVLLDPGDTAWVEEPGYWLVHQVLKASGCNAVPVPVDHEGLNVAAGMKLDRNARAVFVAPSHQYPLGVTMSAARRLQLLAWAQRSNAWVIEDDYDSEYRYDSMPIASLQGLDRHDRVIYFGTFSKVMFPSLRLGYVIVPPDLVERFATMRHAMDLAPAYATQAAMAEFIREGHFARHVRRMRPIYAERRKVLVDAIGDDARILGAEAGMHLTMLIDQRRDDRKIAVNATDLILSPLSSSYAGPPRRGFALGFGNASASQIPAAVRKLKSLLLAATVVLLGACAHTPAFRVTSPAFAAGATMPDSTVFNGLDCHGPNASPALQWSGAPAATKSYALILDDYQARGGDGFIHWVVYDIPPTTTSLPENGTAGKNAYNDFLRREYDGPCPPEGPPHKYRFTVFALDLPSIDDAGTPMTWRKLRFIIRGHVLAQASLTALRGH